MCRGVESEGGTSTGENGVVNGVVGGSGISCFKGTLSKAVLVLKWVKVDGAERERIQVLNSVSLLNSRILAALMSEVGIFPLVCISPKVSGKMYTATRPPVVKTIESILPNSGF